MKDKFIVDESNELAEDRVTEYHAGQDGIEVGESIDIERIELRSRPATTIGNLGWETVQPGNDLEALFVDDDDVLDWDPEESGDAVQNQLAELEDEHLHLAAELADLRRVATEREASLQELLGKSRALLHAREAELSDQEAQIASLTLECDGLRARLSDHDTPLELPDEGAMKTAGASAGTTSAVRNLMEQLAERGQALKVAGEDAERLERERAELADALAARGSQVAKLLARLARSATRLHSQDEFKTGLGGLLGKPTGGELDAAGVPLPGSEEPTLAVDEPPDAKAAPADEEQAASPEAAPGKSPAGERRRRTTAAKVPARERRRRTGVGIRRYLIALDPAREEVCELAARRMYVGRGVEADVRITDVTASRLHAVLHLERGSTVVEDASSTNGVYVNMVRVRRAVLLDGDTVAFGTVRFQYRVGPAVASTA